MTELFQFSIERFYRVFWDEQPYVNTPVRRYSAIHSKGILDRLPVFAPSGEFLDQGPEFVLESSFTEVHRTMTQVNRDCIARTALPGLFRIPGGVESNAEMSVYEKCPVTLQVIHDHALEVTHSKIVTATKPEVL